MRFAKLDFIRKVWIPALIGLMMGLSFFLRFPSLYDKSPNVDEPMHIIAGYSHLMGSLKINFEHPPFFKALSTVWLKLKGVNSPVFNAEMAVLEPVAVDTKWTSLDPKLVDDFFNNNSISGRMIVFYARLAPFLLSFLFLPLFLWILWKLIGDSTKILFSSLWLFSPAVVTSAQYVMTDLPMVIFAMLALAALYRYFRQREKVWFGLAILFLGLTIGAKFSGIIVVIAVVMAILINALWQRKTRGILVRTVKELMVLGLSLVLMLGIFYGFEVRKISDDAAFVRIIELSDQVAFKNVFSKVVGFIHDQNIPVPLLTFWKGIDFVMLHNAVGHTSSLLGDMAQNPTWQYFPLVMFLKLTLAETAIFLLMILLFFVYLKKTVSERRSLFLVFGMVFLFFAYFSATSRIQIGMRHYLLLLPIIYLLAGELISRIPRITRTVLVVIISLLQLAAFMRVQPYFDTHLNELVDRPGNAYEYLGDSNFDHEQNFYYLAEFVMNNPECNSKPIYALYWSHIQFEDVGINVKKLPQQKVDGPACLILANTVRTTNTKWFEPYKWIDDYQPKFNLANTYDIFILN